MEALFTSAPLLLSLTLQVSCSSPSYMYTEGSGAFTGM